MANDHVIDVKVRADTTDLSKGLADAEKDLGKAGAGFSKYGTDAEKSGAAAKGAASQIEKLGTSVKASGAATLAAREAARQYAASLDGVDASLQKNGKTLDITTAAGRANQAALDGIAGAGLRSAEAMKKAGASQAEVDAHMRGANDSLAVAAEKFGTTREAAHAMAGELMHVSQETQGFVEKNRGHMETLGKDAAIMGGAVLAGIGLAVHAYSEFSGRMAQVQSLSHAGAAEMDVLTKSALSMGTAFGLSANDVADAEIELVKAGVSVKEMMGGALPGALALAAAGQIDVGKATEIATIALTQFNLKGKDVPHVADLLAAGADKALGGVSELGDGLKQGGLVASQFGLTIDDTVGTLSAFANAGLLGSDAGTSMKTMFLALASPSKQAQQALDQYNITAYDAQGKFKGVADLAGQLHDKLGPLSDAQRNAALSTIFGTDAMRSASVLMKEGSAGIQKWIKDVNDQGFAAVQAAGKMDSLNGDFKKLQASFETGLIKMGAASDGFLRPVVKGLTDAIAAFSNMDPAVQGSVVAIAAVTGGVALLAGGLLTVIPKLHDSITAFKTLAEKAPGTAGALGTVGKAAGIAAAALVTLQVAAAIFTEKHTKSAEDYGQALLAVSKAAAGIKGSGLDSIFGNYDKEFGVAVSNVGNLGDAVHRLANQDDADGITKAWEPLTNLIGLPKGEISQLEDRLKGLGEAMGNLVKTGGAETAAKSFQQLTTEFEKNGKTAQDALDYVPGYREALKGMANDMKVPINDQDLLNLALGKIPQKMLDAQNSTEGQAKMAEAAAKAAEAQQKALDELGIAADGTIIHLDRLVQSMQASGLISISADQAAINYQKSLEAVDAAVVKNGKNLDITTKGGKENMETWLGQASAANAATLAYAKNGMSSEELQVNLTAQYTQLKDNAIAFGKSGDEADTMARKALGIPKDAKIDTAIQNYADTMAKAQAVKKAAEDIPKHVTITIDTFKTTFEKLVGLPASAVSDGSKGQGAGVYAPGFIPNSSNPLKKAGGGAVYGRGPKGVDSEPHLLARGEHVLSDSDVDAMGGQAAVYAFRKQLHNGGVRPTYATPAPAAPAAMGGFAAPQVMGDIYVQNPFTGEYLLAKVDSRAAGVVSAADAQSQFARRGR